MLPEIQEKLEQNGFEVKNTMERFMNNEMLYIKFMKKLLEDHNYTSLMAAVNEKDYSNAFVHAHTLKGVLANLGLVEPLAKLLPVVKRLRSEQSVGIVYGSSQSESGGVIDDEAAFQRDVEKFSERYENACEIIKALF